MVFEAIITTFLIEEILYIIYSKMRMLHKI